MKWIPPPEEYEYKQNLEVSNLTKVPLLKLAECFAELNAKSFDEMREILRTFKNDRFGKAMKLQKQSICFGINFGCLFGLLVQENMQLKKKILVIFQQVEYNNVSS